MMGLASDLDRRSIANANGRTENCPAMVGPVNDGEYYCRGQEFGYCDRRNGLCVCNQGYTGLDCSACKPSYYKTGSLCYPKSSCIFLITLAMCWSLICLLMNTERCPNDCSQGGICDEATGTCNCFLTRKGDDCAQLFCQFDPRCVSCTNTTCLSCVESFFVDPVSQSCGK